MMPYDNMCMDEQKRMKIKKRKKKQGQLLWGVTNEGYDKAAKDLGV